MVIEIGEPEAEWLRRLMTTYIAAPPSDRVAIHAARVRDALEQGTQGDDDATYGERREVEG
jgi:hypothetical protein